MIEKIDKHSLLEFVIRYAEGEVAKYKQIYGDAQDRANEEEGAMHSRYSTFKEEGQYLAEGLKDKLNQAKLGLGIAQVMRSELGKHDFNKVKACALVEVELSNDSEMFLFIFPSFGGLVVEQFGVTIISHSSPLGKALLNKEEDDEFTYVVNGVKREGMVIRVA